MNLIKERKKKKCEGGSYITFNIKSSYSFLRSQVRYEQAQKKEKKKSISYNNKKTEENIHNSTDCRAQNTT